MTVSSEHGDSRIGGSILVVGAETEEFAPALQVLDSLADTTLVPADEALVTLARLDADVLVVDERDRALLADAALLRPALVRIVLRSADGVANGLDADTVVVPRPIDTAALRAVCTVALRCANARRQARDLESQNHRLRGVGLEAMSFTPDELDELDCYEGILTQTAGMRRVSLLVTESMRRRTRTRWNRVSATSGSPNSSERSCLSLSRVRAGCSALMWCCAMPKSMRWSSTLEASLCESGTTLRRKSPRGI